MTRTSLRSRARPFALVALVATFLALVVGPIAPARAASSGDPGAQRDEVRRKKAAVAGQIDALNASGDEVQQALDALDQNVRGAKAQQADAQRAADAARRDADAAQHEADAAQARIDELRSQVATAAIDAYVHPPGDQVMDVFQQDTANQAATKSALMDVASGTKLDVVDEYRAAKQQLEQKRDEAAQARAAAEAKADAAREKAAGFESARSQQAQLAAQVDQRINEKLAESDALSRLDKSLSDQIASEQAALAARVKRASASDGGGGGGGGGGGRAVIVSRPGSIALSTVNGITVASSIAGQLAGLIDAASAAGFRLGGGGYRDSSSQIALRRAHCGSSDYAIYQMPASQCSPPTAPPGSSMHEQGLAVDFTANGKLLARGDAAFAWMQGNAGRFGFRNLPSEPWHWSTNGN